MYFLYLPAAFARHKKRAPSGALLRLFAAERFGQALDGDVAVALHHMRGKAGNKLVVVQALDVTDTLEVDASNLHFVVQMPQPTHMYSSSTTAPQPRQRSVSFFICSSVRVPRRSRKVLTASAGLPRQPSGAPVRFRPRTATRASSLSMERYSLTARADDQALTLVHEAVY